MEKGTIVEYIERQKVVCAVICDLQGDRICVLAPDGTTQQIPKKRIVLTAGMLSAGEIDNWPKMLLKTNNERIRLSAEISVTHIWEATRETSTWLDIEEIVQIWGSGEKTPDRLAATFRALFEEKVHFQFSGRQFRPNTVEKIEEIQRQEKERIRQEELILEGKEWVEKAIALKEKSPEVSEEIKDCLKSVLYYDNQLLTAKIGDKINKTSMTVEKLFELLVQAKILSKDENIELYQSNIPIFFPDQINTAAQALSVGISKMSDRHDITHLPVYTIDGEFTEDFDDGVSWEVISNGFRLGIHITDVAECIKRETALDEEACLRASSIYMPDQQIPMLPPQIAYDICSMKEGVPVPAVSVWINLSPRFDIVDWQIELTLVRVKKNLTYREADELSQTDEMIKSLYMAALAFQKQRKNQHAIILNLPEIHVWIDKQKEIFVESVDREKPGRMMVTEFMVLANTLMATFLAAQRISAIFGGQTEPKNRIAKETSDLYENWMQKKQLGRMSLSTEPVFHATLGTNTYITATSPIRRYIDLVMQRQLRAALGADPPYTKKEVEFLIPLLEPRLIRIHQLQFRRHRYWILRYLETHIGSKIKAIALQSGRQYVTALLSDYLLECEIPLSAGIKVTPGTTFEATLQYVNARKNRLSLFLT